MKRAHWKSAAAMALAALAALAVAGCSSAGGGPSSKSGIPSASALRKEVSAAIKNADSVHMSGNVTSSGQHISLNLSMTRSGDLYGQVTAGPQSYTVLVTQGLPYVKLDAGFLKLAHLPSSLCAKVCGKYLKLPASSAKSLLSGASWSKFVGPFASSVPDLSYAGTTTVDGKAAWKVLGNTRSDAAYLSAAAPHYPLRVVHNNQHIDFSQWNAAVIPPPPSGKALVSLSNLGA